MGEEREVEPRGEERRREPGEEEAEGNPHGADDGAPDLSQWKPGLNKEAPQLKMIAYVLLVAKMTTNFLSIQMIAYMWQNRPNKTGLSALTIILSINQPTAHLKRCNPAACWVKDRKHWKSHPKASTDDYKQTKVLKIKFTKQALQLSLNKSYQS